MPKYNVHVYAVVRVQFEGLEAETPQDAISAAIGNRDLHASFSPAGKFALEAHEYADDNVGYLVDQIDSHGERTHSKYFFDESHLQLVLQDEHRALPF